MSDRRNQQPRKGEPMGGMGRGMQPGEKPKNLKNQSNSLHSTSESIKLRFLSLCSVQHVRPCSTLRDQKSSEKQQQHCLRD